jgi:DNA polymerase I-like protein with 3'-5' exonuclease and polymerase domains
MNYIISKNPDYFKKIIPGQIALTKTIGFCNLEDMILPDVIAVDTETTGLQARNCDLFCIQIGSGDNNYIIQLYDDNYEFEDVIPYLIGKTMIFHNALFDLGFMYKHGFYPEDVLDTMLASKILLNGKEDSDNWYAPFRHDFGAVMKRELGIIYDKTDQKNIHLVKLSQPSTIEYSFNDVDKLIELHDVLQSKIIKQGFSETYKLHCRYIRALAYMEQCGLPISSELWKAKMEQDIENTLKWKTTIEEYIFDNLPQFADQQVDMFDDKKRINVSVSSPIQMIKVFQALKIPTKDKDGNDSINENIIKKSKHEFVAMWLEFQQANHRVTTFGDSIYKQIEDERIYTNFNPMVDTSRLSTRKGNINFLNFPSDDITRYCFKANKGKVMIVCDYSGQETVVAADLSGDAAMTASVVNGDDLHCAFARILFPELAPLTDEQIIKNHKAKRQNAKAPRFAFQYGGSAYTIHLNEGIPLMEAQKIEDAFKLLHEGLYDWGEKVFFESVKKGYIESADGWKLFLPKYDKYLQYEIQVKMITKEQWRIYKQGKLDYKKKWDEEEKGNKYEYIFPEAVKFYKSKKTEVSQYFKLKSEYGRLALNNPVQARSAHQLKRATAILFDWIVNNGYVNIIKIVNTIHDEIVCECPEELAEITKIAVQNAMLEGGNYYLSTLKIKADANYGPSWGEAKG